MVILVIHSSVTQRRVFLNCLRKNGYRKVRAFEDHQQALEGLNRTHPEITIIEKDVLVAREPRSRVRLKQSLLQRSETVLVTSYEFTQSEAIQLLDIADELLLMPFRPEVLYHKIKQLCS
jgi:CheY-like chemotaxis protein